MNKQETIKQKQYLLALKSLLERGDKFGFNLEEYLVKINSLIENIGNDKIKIVLLGSFSDGKTSVIAGLLGEVIDDMKIDIDESSDEIRIYTPATLNKKYEIVDTPGLFGSKTKDIDGQTVKFSEITEKYISEADILLYVSGAVNPYKESHTETINKILREYKKLDSTIFVINKMDETGVDLLDAKDFQHMSKIKSDFLTDRLSDAIKLIKEEKEKIKVVCIAADPYGEGLEYWFTEKTEYHKSSHILCLEKVINNTLAESKTSLLKSNAYYSVSRDLIYQMQEQIKLVEDPLSSTLKELQNDFKDIIQKRDELKEDLIDNKAVMTNRIANLKIDIFDNKLKNANLETLQSIIEHDIGIQDNKLTFYIYERNINQILSECSSSNKSAITIASEEIETKFKKQDETLIQLAKTGSAQLKRLTITNKHVLATRDFLKLNIKFKPWGAIKLGKKLTKVSKGLGVFTYLSLEAWDWYTEYKNQQKAEEIKENIKNAIRNYEADLYGVINKDEKYFENFAPDFIELNETIKEREFELNELDNKLNNIRRYDVELNTWLSYKDIEDVEFEEL